MTPVSKEFTADFIDREYNLTYPHIFVYFRNKICDYSERKKSK